MAPGEVKPRNATEFCDSSAANSRAPRRPSMAHASLRRRVENGTKSQSRRASDTGRAGPFTSLILRDELAVSHRATFPKESRGCASYRCGPKDRRLDFGRRIRNFGPLYWSMDCKRPIWTHGGVFQTHWDALRMCYIWWKRRLFSGRAN